MHAHHWQSDDVAKVLGRYRVHWVQPLFPFLSLLFQMLEDPQWPTKWQEGQEMWSVKAYKTMHTPTPPLCVLTCGQACYHLLQ